MKMRSFDSNGDVVFGANAYNQNNPQAVADLATCRMQMYQGEWCLDTSDGTPWFQNVFGYNSQVAADFVLRSRLLGTQGLDQILSFSSQQSPARKYILNTTFTTAYGTGGEVST